jgi:hypothetical protein
MVSRIVWAKFPGHPPSSRNHTEKIEASPAPNEGPCAPMPQPWGVTRIGGPANLEAAPGTSWVCPDSSGGVERG